MTDRLSGKQPEGAECGVSRRDFMRTAGATAAGVTIVPRHVLGRQGTPAPSDRLNIAGVGVGGMGRSNLINLASENVVALCDVDWGYANRAFERLGVDITRAEGGLQQAATDDQRRRVTARLASMRRLREQWPRATQYTDFREMLDRQKDIDAVLVATADHTHAVIAMAALSLGKHVYVQKPLTWSVFEARALAKKAAETRLATQMGNQGHSFDDARKVIEYVQSGAIGEVREVHVWTNRPLAYWPQGIPRPAPMTTPPDDLRWNMTGVNERFAHALTGNYPRPDSVAWDLFVGPAPMIDYHPLYHPHHWRGWVEFGMGALGDMGAHLVDHPFWALDLGFPSTVETVSTPFNKASYPTATTTYYEFPARGARPSVKLTWYDGGLKPPRPEELGEDQLKEEGGVLFVGSKGKLLHDTYGMNPRLLPATLHESVGTPAVKLPRIATTHEMNWVDAAKGKTEASCPFSYASRLTEVMLLGVVALRAGTKIHYDGEQMRITNVPGANDLLTREYRKGWSL
jgi:predicted dehydrogenase